MPSLQEDAFVTGQYDKQFLTNTKPGGHLFIEGHTGLDDDLIRIAIKH